MIRSSMPDVLDLTVALPSQDASATQHLLMVDPAAAFVLHEQAGQAAVAVTRSSEGGS